MNRYRHKRLSPAEFRALLRRAGLKVGDFLFFTGRKREQVEQFETGRGDVFTPTMGDAMILELATDARTRERMFAIAESYIDQDKQAATNHERRRN